MKKRILATVAILILVATTVISAEYPLSPDWEFPLPTDGKILTGELIGTDSWGSNPDVGFDKAWDGDSDTFWDPAGVGEANYTGVKLDQAYILTEIRIMPRHAFLDRFNGATIQGSNDGENWTDIFINLEAAPTPDFYCFTADAFETGSNTGYSYYRYVNNSIHGDVAEVELYGNPAGAAAEPEPEPAPEPEPEPEPVPEPEPEPVPEPEVTPEVVETPPASTPVAAETGDSFTLIVSILALTLISTYVVMRKRIAR